MKKKLCFSLFETEDSQNPAKIDAWHSAFEPSLKSISMYKYFLFRYNIFWNFGLISSSCTLERLCTFCNTSPKREFPNTYFNYNIRSTFAMSSKNINLSMIIPPFHVVRQILNSSNPTKLGKYSGTVNPYKINEIEFTVVRWKAFQQIYKATLIQTFDLVDTVCPSLIFLFPPVQIENRYSLPMCICVSRSNSKWVEKKLILYRK